MLFVLAGLIGDSVMCTPAIIEARRIWPNSRIAIVGKKHNRELLSGCEFYDDFFELNSDPLSLRGAAEVRKFETWLTDQHFDAALILLGDQFAHLLAKARIPVRVGVMGTLMHRCLTHKYDIGSARTWGADERLNALRSLGYEATKRSPTLSSSAKGRAALLEKLAKLGLPTNSNFVVVHPFGSTSNQWWNIALVAKLARFVDTQFGLKLVVIGKEYSLNGQLVSPQIGLGAGKAVIDTINQLELSEMIAAIDRAEMLVTTDSGPFHVAGALRKPTLGLFRARRPEHSNAYNTADILFGNDIECERNCSWDKCRTSPCVQMENIGIDDVTRKVGLLLGKHTREDKDFRNHPNL
ncbi:MAG: glycosyltransferase family 9 protein [Pyrinomonadaceae bacterium]|nr:glycosyltransferase family 9 protein [Pyrinomonadaceae bacterium]